MASYLACNHKMVGLALVGLLSRDELPKLNKSLLEVLPQPLKADKAIATRAAAMAMLRFHTHAALGVAHRRRAGKGCSCNAHLGIGFYMGCNMLVIN